MPPNYDRLKALLLSLRALSAEQRRIELERLGADDPEMAEELSELLAHESGGGVVRTAGAIEAVAGAVAHATGEDDQRLGPGTIGPYRLLGVLGEGGMGTVYRAEQTTPIKRAVALKLIRRGFDIDRIVARFESERQMLARMGHPHIARVFDAGSTPEGRPYFVMELVDGAPLTTVADARRLDVDQRLALFLAVCRGVQHAHQKGIIHRDLKPSNVLVTEQDGQLVPKIIDFGIAKAVEPDPDDAAHTQPGLLIGTPEYSSPEQAGVIEAAVDTRTDVYALGILLYELLAGVRPFTFTRSSPGAIQRVLGGQAPTVPSRRVAASAADDEIAAARGTTSERLARRLRGDLDSIALRALARDPADRYGSVEALAADVQRHLEGRPIDAHESTVLYRASKFVRRHAAAVAAGLTVALMIVGFAGYATWQSARLAEERDRARVEARTAQSVSDFLVGLFRESDPGESRGAAVTAREVLDRGASEASRLEGDPLVRARLMSTMGDVYQSLGLYDESRTLFDAARTTYESAAVADPAGLAETLDGLGVVAHDTGDLETSETYLQQALALRREVLGTDHKDTAITLTNLAITIRGRGRHQEAEPLYREALAINRRVLGDAHEEVAWSLFSLGWAVHQQGRLDEAEPLYREAAEMQRRLLGADHPDLAGTLNSLGGIRLQRGEFEEARRVWQEALDIYQKVYGDQHAATARANHNLAQALLGLGRFEEAEQLSRRAVALFVEMVGTDHPRTAVAIRNHGVALWRLGRHDEADERLRTALAAVEQDNGTASIEAGVIVARLARLTLDRGRLDAAVTLAERAAAIGRQEAEASPAQSAQMLQVLAQVQVASGAAPDAVPVWREVVALLDRTQTASPQSRAIARAGLGYALALAGDRGEGTALIDQASATLSSSMPADHPDRQRVEEHRRSVVSAAVPSGR